MPRKNVTFGGRPAASVEAVEKERAILERLERIDGMRSGDAPAGTLLDEVRALLSEAEEWVRVDPAVPARAAEAVERSREALAAGEIGELEAGAALTTR
jgi:hypothetical protein